VQAQQQGCDIVTGATVLSLARANAAHPAAGAGPLPGRPNGRQWELRVAHTDARLQARETGPLLLRAQRVILAAGALGSPEILLRSRSEHQVFSGRLGQGFSCNGDNIAAARGLAQPVNGAADEDLPLAQRCVGPTITGSVKLQGGQRHFLLQEFAVPGPMRRLFDEIVTTAGTVAQLASGDCQPHAGKQRDPLAVDPVAMARTLLLGVIGHDDASGRLHLALPDPPAGAVPQMGALRICWPEARHGHELTRAHEAVRVLVEGKVPVAGGPSLVPNPAWRPLPGGLQDLVSQATGPVLTVHPLGGCGIGFGTQSRQRGGVVSALGAVFNAAPGADDWEGELLVLDGSIVPLSLGVNPALTIAALALHAMAHWRQAWQLRPAGEQPASEQPPADPVTLPGCQAQVSAPPCQPGEPPTPRRTEVEVIERLWGPARLAGFKNGAVVELTLAYQPAAVQQLIGAERVAIDANPARSHLRLFDQATWDSHHLQAANDDERARHVQLDAPLRGTLRFLHRGHTRPSGRVWRGLWAWLYNRGTRDLWDLCVRDRLARWTGRAPPPPPDDGAGPRRGLGDDWLKFGRLASRAGEIRLFDYDLRVDTPTIDRRDLARALMAQPQVTGTRSSPMPAVPTPGSS
jgi:cholesterol oxidase